MSTRPVAAGPRHRQQPEESMYTTTPTGRLTRKIQYQLSRSVSTPPASTPITPPPERTKPNTPIAFARSACSVKSVISSERDRRDHGADPLNCAGGDKQLLRVGDPAGERREREGRDPDQEQAPVSEQVAEAAAEEEEAAEREQVRVDGPGERGLREAEVVPDQQQRDVHDRAVQHDHQVPEAEDVERGTCPGLSRVMGGVLSMASSVSNGLAG